MKEVKDLEVALHQSETRSNLNKINKILHPNFLEIGYSGKTYDLASMKKSLTSNSIENVVWSQGYEFFEYAPNVVQVVYLSAQIQKDGELTRHAKRTSIWVKESGSWKMRFHQGTPTEPFEIEHA